MTSTTLYTLKKPGGQEVKCLYLYWVDRYLLFYYITFCTFLYILNSLYWTVTSKEMLEVIKFHPPMSEEISSHVWSLSFCSNSFHSPSSFCLYIKVKYAFLSASPPWGLDLSPRTMILLYSICWNNSHGYLSSKEQNFESHGKFVKYALVCQTHVEYFLLWKTYWLVI